MDYTKFATREFENLKVVAKILYWFVLDQHNLYFTKVIMQMYWISQSGSHNRKFVHANKI
jgi:hypothetical protein